MNAVQTQCTACASMNLQKIQVFVEKESLERREGDSLADTWRVTTHYRCLDCGHLFHVQTHLN